MAILLTDSTGSRQDSRQRLPHHGDQPKIRLAMVALPGKNRQAKEPCQGLAQADAGQVSALWRAWCW